MESDATMQEHASQNQLLPDFENSFNEFEQVMSIFQAQDNAGKILIIKYKLWLAKLQYFIEGTLINTLTLPDTLNQSQLRPKIQ
jgi:hypothetical protein